MKARHEARLRKFATALAVGLLHVAAIRALLVVRDLLVPSARVEPAPVTTWIYLPPETPAVTASAAARGVIMAPLVDENATPGVLAVPISLVPPVPPALPLPLLAPLTNTNTHVFAVLGDYFACDFANFDKLDEQRNRCALRLSHLGEIALLPPDYVDGKSTPFSLFGAHGTFAITPPTQNPFDLLAKSIGCGWGGGLCRTTQPDKFGLDPDDPKRLTAAAHFDLGKGWSLDAGGQGLMQSYLGGARFVLTGGATVSYRW